MFDSLRDAVDVVPYEYAHGLANKDVRNKTGKKSFSYRICCGRKGVYLIFSLFGFVGDDVHGVPLCPSL